jgi:hypothetical protein
MERSTMSKRKCIDLAALPEFDPLAAIAAKRRAYCSSSVP